MMDSRAITIRQLNDELRVFHTGGKIVMSANLANGAIEEIEDIMNAVAAFNDFTENNDPYREHDCAFVEVEGFGRVMFKIDYYNNDMSAGSEDPSDRSQTTRVMTVMLPEDY